jgi:catechol 2,3-dioxygenase-like lactoylglutathione lyase family enzyme
MIIGLHHVQITIPRGAEPTAREFYCGLLGLKEVPKPEVIAASGGFWLDTGVHLVHLGTEDGIDRAATKSHVAYEVTNLDEWRKRLADAGVATTDSIPLPGYHRLKFRDPFGNRIELMHRVD